MVKNVAERQIGVLIQLLDILCFLRVKSLLDEPWTSLNILGPKHLHQS